MLKEADGVSEQLFQEGASFLFEHIDVWVTRRQLQEALHIGKSTACRLMTALTMRLFVDSREGKRGSRMTIRLSSEEARTLDSQVLPVPSLTQADRYLLTLLIKMADSSDAYGKMAKTLQKHLIASGYAPRGVTPVFSAASLRQHLTPKAKDALITLFSAIEQKKAVTLTYQAPTSEQPKQYTIQPKGIFEQDGNLYLFSYNPHHDCTMVNACARIQGAVILEEAIKVPRNCKELKSLADPFGIAMDSEETVVIVLIAKQQAFFEKEKEWPLGTVTKEMEDGSLEMKIKTKNRGACIRWLLSLGPSAKVLAPDDLVTQVRDELQKNLAQYD